MNIIVIFMQLHYICIAKAFQKEYKFIFWTIMASDFTQISRIFRAKVHTFMLTLCNCIANKMTYKKNIYTYILKVNIYYIFILKDIIVISGNHASTKRRFYEDII